MNFTLPDPVCDKCGTIAAMSKHFFKLLLLFIIMIVLGLIGVFLLAK